MPQAAIPIAAAVAGAGAGALFNRALAPKVKGINPTPRASGVVTPGYNVSLSGNRARLIRGDETQTALDLLRTAGLQQGDYLSTLLGRVRPGFSELRAVRLGELENARRRAVGNLRENLARRRLSGSSFANDSLVRAENEFAGTRDKIAAQTFMDEIRLSREISSQRTAELQSLAARYLDQGNFELQAGANFANGLNVVASNLAQAQAQLQAGAAQGAGAGLAPYSDAISGAVSSGITNYFSNNPGTSTLYNPAQINNYGY